MGDEVKHTSPAPAAPNLFAPLGAAEGADAAAQRVLIIDDNIDCAETLMEVVMMGGHVAEVAHDGQQGVERARSFRPSVVLYDIGLPIMDGYEVASALRADPVFADTTLVALTGYARPDDQRRAHAAGFDRHVAKPVSPSKLVELLRPPRAP
jgi:two-component system CheB/CheR fusion protein